MTNPSSDPYETLGIQPDASDAEVRSAYRRLVQRHHPDHNNGSAQSTRRFEAIQEAYARVVAERRSGVTATRRRTGAASTTAAANTARPAGGTPYDDRDINARVAAMERELYEARLAQERVRQAAREATREATRQATPETPAAPRRATPEELGYVTTDDTVGKILDDASDAFSKRWGRSRGWSFAERLANLFGDAD